MVSTREHVERFWHYLETETVRILVDLRREMGNGCVYHDSSSFPDDVAKALVADRRARPSVKPLQWTHFSNGNASARTDTGLLYFAHPDGSCRLWNGPSVKGGATLDEAKAAAQADYERRILSALENRPVALADANSKSPIQAREE